MPSEKIFTIFGDDHVSQVQRQESRHFLLLELGKLSLLSPRPNEVIDTGQELILIKRLRQIIIRSCVETFDARLRARAGRDENHRGRTKSPILANSFQQIGTAHPWHHDVGEDQVRMQGPGLFQCLCSILRKHYSILSAQHPLQIASHVSIIVGYKQ